MRSYFRMRPDASLFFECARMRAYFRMRPDADLIATAHHRCYLTCPNAKEGQFGRRGAHAGRRSISISRCLSTDLPARARDLVTYVV